MAAELGETDVFWKLEIVFYYPVFFMPFGPSFDLFVHSGLALLIDLTAEDENGKINGERGVREKQLWKESTRVCRPCESTEGRLWLSEMEVDGKDKNYKQASVFEQHSLNPFHDALGSAVDGLVRQLLTRLTLVEIFLSHRRMEWMKRKFKEKMRSGLGQWGVFLVGCQLPRTAGFSKFFVFVLWVDAMPEKHHGNKEKLKRSPFESFYCPRPVRIGGMRIDGGVGHMRF